MFLQTYRAVAAMMAAGMAGSMPDRVQPFAMPAQLLNGYGVSVQGRRGRYRAGMKSKAAHLAKRRRIAAGKHF